MPDELDPIAWLVRDFGTDPAAGLDGVADAVLARTRLVSGDRAAVRAVLDVATQGSAWRAFQLKTPMNVTILQQMRSAASGSNSDATIVVDNTISQVQLAMFPYPADSGAPVVGGGNYFKQWWQQHVRHR